eukprot:TRINITY_DN10193_c0_g1_i4.p1 TRINITY_DN10193_c0_g1~~TRINITY_DN10193_c0_g1_i4.p1  ORF type:complete len:243 (-),score=64.98 TRINITY_DN10193_c0_g1_i4:89-781(-)
MAEGKSKASAGARPVRGPNYYLVAYNTAQFLGWSVILFQLVQHFVNGGDVDNVWPSVMPLLMYFQFAAVLEIVHSIVGLVSTGVFTVLVQVASRVFLVSICMHYPEAHSQWAFPLMVAAWSVTEVVRYSFYAASQFGPAPFPLVWLRYTLFIVLYPAGVSGELLCLYSMLHVARDFGYFPLVVAEFALTFRIFIIVVMCLYPFGLPGLYLHMLHQRKRYVGGKNSKKKTA